MSAAKSTERPMLPWRLMLHAAAPLALGVLVYLVARPSPRVFRWLGASEVPHLRGLPRFVVGQLPDAAWAYALTATVLLVWRDGSPRARAAWGAVAVVTAIGWELGQRAHLVPGRFDPADLVASVVACLVAVALLGRGAHPLRSTTT